MLNYSEEDIKNAAELRDWVLKQISEKQEEIDRLKRLLLLIDNLLKQGSFKPASKLERSINNSESSTINERPQDSNKATMKVENKKSNSTATTNSNENVSPFTETRDLKRLKDNLLLAKVNISSQTIEITPEKGLTFYVDTPPFKSFFIKRILEGMITQDRTKNRQKQLSNQDLLDYTIDENEGKIKKIIINNYREKERLTDIINTSAWVFTRMLEKEKDNASGSRT
ncbi:MAG TPA: hypothetical protein VE595_04685 [Nitrososphaeraceae archaeon]|jgi:hypothetical protein|nr:hypothetical protein [Nitrososphaeraceae archaeon]HYZ95776.1 hypothetical protein [Nitrososphaeraceae archaeon]